MSSTDLALKAASEISLDALITSTSADVQAGKNIFLNAAINLPSADIQAGNLITIDSNAKISSSNFNITSEKLNVVSGASVPPSISLEGQREIQVLTDMAGYRKRPKVIGTITSGRVRLLNLHTVPLGMWFSTN